MSESDDTDVLLLIPPDIFHVPSSDSDTSSNNLTKTDCGRSGVISELVGHMQSLESRISAIEYKDNSLDASVLKSSFDIHSDSGCSYRQTLPRTRFSVSQSTSLQNTPVKPRKYLSVPSTPNGYSSWNCTNILRNDMSSGCCLLTAASTNATTTNTSTHAKHDAIMLNPIPSKVSASCGTGLSHATVMSTKKETPLSLYPNDQSIHKSSMCFKSQNPSYSAMSIPNLNNTSISQQQTHSRIVQEMELSEVDELLQEMEATELELSKRINSTCGYKPVCTISSTQDTDTKNTQEKETQHKFIGTNHNFDILAAHSHKKSHNIFADISLPYGDPYQLDETDKIISQFKTWAPSMPTANSNEYTAENISNVKNTDHITSSAINGNINPKQYLLDKNVLHTNEANTSGINTQSKCSVINTNPLLHINEAIKFSDVVLPPKIVQSSNTEHLLDLYKMSQQNEISQNEKETAESSKSTVHVGTNTDLHLRKFQRLLSLSDFWDTNTTRSQEETLRIKLEEEKFRREHCEHLIQELQKRLLEQQEKVAVAVRIDNEKNNLISHFHVAWSKLKQHVEILEAEHKNLQTSLQNITEKHQDEMSEQQTHIKRLECELSKALDLAGGYKEKSDTTIKEKVDLLKTHADELESYKSLVQEAENRYEQMKSEFNKLLEKHRQNEEILKSVQSELNKERLRNSEVRSEMSVIHKALDACEAELTVLKQEKESLQLKLKEEINRNAILEQKTSSLVVCINEAKCAEKLAKDETKSIAEQKEKIRAELQEVYQKQVDEVVKAKLQEFQTQLDTAETEFLEELKTRQQIIAECAARKIKDVIDKHRLEINLLEEKHKEEKRLCELQLAQAMQRSSMLETHLNSQRTTKSQLAEQLHSVMQKNWQQALHIISGDNADNLTPIETLHSDKCYGTKTPKKTVSMPNCYTKLSQEPIKHIIQSLEVQNPINVQPLEDQNESLMTMNSIENTPLSSRNESKDDLRKYVKMIAEMQFTRDDLTNPRNISSPPLICREVPRKHYLKKELSIMSEDSITWQPASETSTHDVSEYIPISQKTTAKTDQHRNKPPWK